MPDLFDISFWQSPQMRPSSLMNVVCQSAAKCADGHGRQPYLVRETPTDAWTRLAIEPGDLLFVSVGIYHRFTLDEKDNIKALRLFQDEPKWVPYNRGDATDANPHRLEYLKTTGVGA
ncbi:ARD/ARD' family-domain-containing protein [Mycena rosella]|uniref:acireductone dioxygenase (Fe(2+)-requiring) n=1 Tax=Mycena rosella TaxID=1033263 RepID=A0AAD7DI70_MYCRO|nr:ARD/ARD' family-domain-containing protein [Mycena rosella]